MCSLYLSLMEKAGVRLDSFGDLRWSPDSKNMAYHASASGIGVPINGQPGAATSDSDIFVINVDDVLAGRQFRDAVTKPMTKPFHWDQHRKHTFEVPFRCFLPKKVSNLLLTGASLSFTYDTIFMVMRNFPWCTQTGEIAGYAAAQCVQRKISPKELEWSTPYF